MADWKLAINSVTIKQAPLRKAIEIASKSGYDGFGFWTKDLTAYESQEGDLDGITRALKAGHLDACELLAVRKWQEMPRNEFDGAMVEARDVFELSARVGAKVVTSPAGKTLHDKNDWLARLREICDVASSYDLTIALEFIAGRSIPDLATALDIVRSANSERVGVLLDFFHFHRSESNMRDLTSSQANEISLVHVDDVAGKPLGNLTDKDRLFPGDGVLPIKDFFGALRNIGYEGYFSVEIFNDEYWQMDPLDVARKARDKTRAFLKI